MNTDLYPKEIPNWINGEEVLAVSGNIFEKLNPSTGEVLCHAVKSNHLDIDRSVIAAQEAQLKWAETPSVKRGMILHDMVLEMKNRKADIAGIVAAETGKSLKDAFGETEGAIALGLFYASEGQRLYGKTCTSAVPNKYAMTIRQPIGVAGLIVAANTPIANAAWKMFPAMICGNSAILKAAEDTPATAWILGEISRDAGLPSGVLNIIQGYGEEAGASLVAHKDVGVISFTGSTNVGREIAAVAGKRLARVSLELGGKNALVVCDDAKMEDAANWVMLSAFSNAGQRCVAASRIVVFDSIYDDFKQMLLTKTEMLRIGSGDGDDLGPVINERQLKNMTAMVDEARQNGATILIGGHRLTLPQYKNGFYMAPTIVENAAPEDRISQVELFGPITCLYRARDFADALNLVNNSPYGLSACIHTQNVNRAIEFVQKVQTGVAVVNGGTYGSEPHMPFGGMKNSGNGSREPGTEALDVYSELKDVYINCSQNTL